MMETFPTLVEAFVSQTVLAQKVALRQVEDVRDSYEASGKVNVMLSHAKM